MKKLISLLVVMTPIVVHAHPGHGHENPLSPGHYVGNPVHAWPLALSIAAGVVLLNWLLYKRARKNAK